MNSTIDQDDEDTLLQSSHREWAEAQERELQNRDKRAVERFLAGKLKQKGDFNLGAIGTIGCSPAKRGITNVNIQVFA